MSETVPQTFEMREATVLRSLWLPVILTDNNGNIRSFNPAAEQITGFDSEEVAGQPFAKTVTLLDVDTRELVRDFITQTVQQGRLSRPQLLLVSKKGEKIPIEGEGVILRDDAHAFAGILITLHKARQPLPLQVSDDASPKLAEAEKKIRDLESKITQAEEKLRAAEENTRIQAEEHLKSEEALRRSKEWFRSLVEEASPIPWRMDADTLRLIYVGPQLANVLGFAEEKWLGEGFWQSRIHPEDRAEIIQQLSELSQSRGDCELEYRLLNSRDNVVWIRNIVSVIRKEGGASLLHGFMFDITEAKKLEERLRQLQRLEMAERLAMGVSNDFNNMLGVIESCVESLWFVYEADLTGRNYLHQIKTALLRTKTLIRQLQAFSSSFAIRSAKINLNKMMEDIQPLLNMKAPHDISLQWEKSPADLWIEGDSNQIGQLFINLFLYIIDILDDKSAITFKLERAELNDELGQIFATDARGSYALLTASTGSLPFKNADTLHLFEPYHESNLKKQGLELAAIYGIVRKHQGFIRCNTDGGRTQFEIYLPQIYVASTKTTEEETPKIVLPETWLPPEEPITVLLVDNEDLVRQGLKRILERNGILVIEAAQGQEALHAVEKHGKHIDLLISDLVMPGISASELYKQLQQKYADLRILLVSGLAGASAMNKEFSEDTPFLQKPFSSDELMYRISEILPERLKPAQE